MMGDVSGDADGLSVDAGLVPRIFERLFAEMHTQQVWPERTADHSCSMHECLDSAAQRHVATLADADYICLDDRLVAGSSRAPCDAPSWSCTTRLSGAELR